MSEEEGPSAQEIAKQWSMTGPDGYRVYIVPQHMRASMKAYVDWHQPVGRFLNAVLSNDLKEAMHCADGENMNNLPAIVSWFYNNAPADCWGTKGRVGAWEMRHNAPFCAYHPDGHAS